VSPPAGRGAFLAVPACAPGLGGGHLARCAALVRDLRALGREALLFLPESAAAARRLLGSEGFDPAWVSGETGLAGKSWGCVALDLCRTPPGEYRRWAALGPVVAIDEGGPCRRGIDFLIDVLPGASRVRPSLADPSLLPLPREIAKPAARPPAPLKILVSFGREDAAGLGPAAAGALAAKSGGSLEVTLLRGGLGAGGADPPGAETLEKIPALGGRLGEWDLVVTHFGLTAFEALRAGVPALLLSPTRLHEKIARKAGFLSLGVGKGRAGKLPALLLGKGGPDRAFLDGLKKRCDALAARHGVGGAPRRSLADLANGFAPDLSPSCAACGAALRAPLARFPERSYRRCRRCGGITMGRIAPPPVEYGREYFFELYEKQYGKTYIEDFPNLTAMARRRLAMIRPLLPGGAPGPGPAPLLLEIGCAYGPFLAAARDAGFSPYGTDPAGDAVLYVTQTLGIPAERGFFPRDGAIAPRGGDAGRPYDAVALWLVIEHFRDAALALAGIRGLLRPGGVLALSTPSFSGISGRKSLRRFLELSPADHWTVWSPASCKRALAAAGFRVRKTAVTGHHPERFPLLGKMAGGKKGPLYRILLAASRLFSLGDTFEAYAVRD